LPGYRQHIASYRCYRAFGRCHTSPGRHHAILGYLPLSTLSRRYRYTLLSLAYAGLMLPLLSAAGVIAISLALLAAGSLLLSIAKKCCWLR
jgi:hypothetical protein